MAKSMLGPRRHGWHRPVAVPDRMQELRGPLTGSVHLPLTVYSSGLGPGREFDLSEESARIELYQIVLTEGRVEDVCALVDAVELRRLWSRLWLPDHVRSAWEPMLAVAAS